METKTYLIEAHKPFSDSLIWRLSEQYYQKEGVDAWRTGTVPHNLTSSAMVGKTYAELIFAFLKDLAAKGQIHEKVFLLELGAGHGRLAFHILQHLEPLIVASGIDLPSYCYVITDIVEENLLYFHNHPQFQAFLEKGLLDVAYFDGLSTEEIHLRHANLHIAPHELKQPLIAIANYFFDSIPMDLYKIKKEEILAVTLGLYTEENPAGMDEEALLDHLEFDYDVEPFFFPFYEDVLLDEVLDAYRHLVKDTYLLFPEKGIQCIKKLKNLSSKGLMLISMDKGFHQVHDLDQGKKPVMITHGSMSFSVNYHALGQYCEKLGGKALFPSYSTFHLELGCLLFLPESESYTETKSAFLRSVDDYGPDDFIGIKKYVWKHLSDFSLMELLGILRLGAYDSFAFKKMLPYFKEIAQKVTFNERMRLHQSILQTWKMYFNIQEPTDLAFEMAGMLYGLGYYQDALLFFQHSADFFGHSTDSFYNKALCYYQLREDILFVKTVKEAKAAFPDFEQFAHLDKLDLNAE